MFLFPHLLFMRFDWRDDWIPISAHCGVITGYCSLWVAALLIGGVRKRYTRRGRGGRRGGEREREGEGEKSEERRVEGEEEEEEEEGENDGKWNHLINSAERGIMH